MVRTSDPIEGDRNSLASSANFEYGTSLFNSRGYIYDYQSDSSSSTTFGILGESSLLYTDGEVSVTQGSGVESAVVVELKSKSVKNSTFDVLINDSNYERIPAGRSSLIALSPFRTYRLRLKQSNESQELVSLDTEVYEVTLFPGNIIKKTWNAEKIFIALGRLVDEKGQGVRHQRLKGLQEYTITEEDGSFQAEVNGTERVYVSNNDYECEIKIPEKAPQDETIVDLGNIPCSTKNQNKNVELLSFLMPQNHKS
ncbi:MAG: hypothetical protein GYA55_09615 [SAR324 cluster bacterium]|uniref:Pilus assembly protein C-terminal domain-containing protein n=1 Tax=SAR324 cluster bacterium TaxID=2024889 RepID=A0A7X9FT38_9DELT|nr:hypothetical protein [SAR324 cluster bacterium]